MKLDELNQRKAYNEMLKAVNGMGTADISKAVALLLHEVADKTNSSSWDMLDLMNELLDSDALGIIDLDKLK